jgi:hypothetical protein
MFQNSCCTIDVFSWGKYWQQFVKGVVTCDDY